MGGFVIDIQEKSRSLSSLGSLFLGVIAILRQGGRKTPPPYRSRVNEFYSKKSTTYLFSFFFIESFLILYQFNTILTNLFIPQLSQFFPAIKKINCFMNFISKTYGLQDKILFLTSFLNPFISALYYRTNEGN